MKKQNNKKVIKKIENIRKKNNVNWMDILSIALKYSPKKNIGSNEKNSFYRYTNF